jgi:hypothetical protein
MQSLCTALRQTYQRQICQQVIFLKDGSAPSIADIGSPISKRLSLGIIERIAAPVSADIVHGQTAGKRFEDITRDFLQQTFALLQHLRPGLTARGNIAARRFRSYTESKSVETAGIVTVVVAIKTPNRGVNTDRKKHGYFCSFIRVFSQYPCLQYSVQLRVIAD